MPAPSLTPEELQAVVAAAVRDALAAQISNRDSEVQLRDNQIADDRGSPTKEEPMYSWISPKAYKNHKRFRVWCKKLDGTKTYETFDTLEQGQSFIEGAQSKLLTGGHSIEGVIDRYLDTRRPSLKATTLATLGHRLRTIIRDRKRFPVEAFPWAKAWGQHVATQSTDSQHGIHSALTGLLEWTVTASILRRLPDLPKPQGRKRRGKTQLGEDDASSFISAATDAGDPLAIAAATCLLLGLRPGEAMALRVRDLDRGGELLRVATEGGKTEAATRRVEIVADWRPHLLALTAGRPRDAFLFEWTAERKRAGKDPAKSRRDALLRRVEALCKTAELPQIVTQALRGTHATIATEAAATSHAVMAALGHTSFTVTQRHYLASGATERAAAKRVADRIPIARTESRVIGSGKSDPTESTDTA